MKHKMSRKDAEAVMSIIGVMLVLELSTLHDFLEFMIEVEDFIDMPEIDHIEYMSQILENLAPDA